jgi:hypothetical protein
MEYQYLYLLGIHVTEMMRCEFNFGFIYAVVFELIIRHFSM